MASYYWDYRNDTTTATTGGDWTWTDSSTSTSSVAAWYYGPLVTVRQILIEAPRHWGKPEAAAFTRLVNDEIRAGWTIDLWIQGDVAIVDPNIERRPMADFIPLLKDRASQPDRDLIDKFFKAFPIVEPLSSAP